VLKFSNYIEAESPQSSLVIKLPVKPTEMHQIATFEDQHNKSFTPVNVLVLAFGVPPAQFNQC